MSGHEVILTFLPGVAIGGYYDFNTTTGLVLVRVKSWALIFEVRLILLVTTFKNNFLYRKGNYQHFFCCANVSFIMD
jgi:hypothetical protein